MYSNGERGGPLATYLATAAARSDVFTLWTDTAVNRIVRDSSLATGVEVACSATGGVFRDSAIDSREGKSSGQCWSLWDTKAALQE